MPEDEKERRIRVVLTELSKKSAGYTAGPMAEMLGLSTEYVRTQILNALVADGRVNMQKCRNGYNYTYWYHITPRGLEWLTRTGAPADVKGDWSETPTLMPKGNVLPEVKVAPPRKETPVDTPVKKETPPKETPAKPSPAKDTPAKEEGLMTVEGLERVLNTLRTLRSDDDDIDFDIGAIISKAEAKMKASVMACPHCGWEMAVENVGDNKMLVCKGCCLAVTYKRNPRDLGALVKAWNRRTSA